MLKTTHKARNPLPEGWTEHKAPTGHSYYYNSSTKESTYVRPSLNELTLPDAPASSLNPFPSNGHTNELRPQTHVFEQSENVPDQPAVRWQDDRNDPAAPSDRRRYQHRDRPKSKHAIPGCEPWVLVKTRLGRRFVHNLEDGTSFWRFPPDVMKGVIEYDRLERERKEQRDAKIQVPNASQGSVPEPSRLQRKPLDTPQPDKLSPEQRMLDSDGEEYEEVEVTDNEEEEGEDNNEENPSKRLKGEKEEDEKPVDFDEDDIAYQLAAMGEEYGLDPGEYGEEGATIDEDEEGLPLTEEDSKALFKDMLNDYQVNPYQTWEKLIEDGRIIEDDRYTVLPNMRSRKEVWGEWSRERIQLVKERRAAEEKEDPRISYFAFLEAKGTPKLYWPEFRRKYQKAPEMRNTKITDKEREKWYREFINRLKLPERTLKADLVALLKSTPLQSLNRSSSLENLPPSILTDLRFISLRSSVRDSLIQTHIESLSDAPSDDPLSYKSDAASTKQQEERDRRERALAERQQKADEEKRKQRGALEQSKGRLREEEEIVQRAMRVDKGGLKGYM